MTRWSTLGLISGLILVTFFPRVLDLDAFRAPDEDRWMANTNNFTASLAHGRLTDLMQLPHPGLTTQWLGALTTRYDDWAVRKMPLVIGQSLLILLAGYVFGRLWGKAGAAATVATLAANPLLYAHTRVYAMDSLLALFSVVALGFLLLWRQEKEKQGALRYLAASTFCTAAAILSKLPGIVLLPIIAGSLVYWSWRDKKMPATSYQLLTTWLLAFLLSLTLIFPSLAIDPANVLSNLSEFFRSDDYQELHQLGAQYYLRTIIFFSTPLHFLTLAGLGWLAWQKKISRLHRDQLLLLGFFAVLFVIQMTLGAKKGDRYILPAFVTLDIIAAFVITQMYRLTTVVDSSQYLVASKIRVRHRLRTTNYQLLVPSYLLLATLAWQFTLIWQTHPHTLAYINPVSKTWFGERRHGWGEGLDVAAQYLNAKSNAAELKVAAYYPNEFAPYFNGKTVPMHEYDTPNVAYVVLYRAMLERGPSAWETDVVNHFRGETPEHVIYFQGVPFVWLYATATNTAASPE